MPDDSIWQVYSPEINVGDKKVPIAHFSSEKEAEKVCEESRRRQIGYEGWSKREISVVSTAETFWESHDQSKRDKALSKLTDEERELLGL